MRQTILSSYPQLHQTVALLQTHTCGTSNSCQRRCVLARIVLKSSTGPYQFPAVNLLCSATSFVVISQNIADKRHNSTCHPWIVNLAIFDQNRTKFDFRR